MNTPHRRAPAAACPATAGHCGIVPHTTVPARHGTFGAPSTQWVQITWAGDRPHFEQPDRFSEVMRTVLAETR